MRLDARGFLREALSYIQPIPVPLVGAEVVEYNPTRDRDGQTDAPSSEPLAVQCGRFRQNHGM